MVLINATLAVQNAVNNKRRPMTEAQRNYLADLANRKGIRLEDTDDKSVAWASEKIEELKAMPDYEFPEISDAETAKIDKLVGKTITELHKWTFAA